MCLYEFKEAQANRFLIENTCCRSVGQLEQDSVAGVLWKGAFKDPLGDVPDDACELGL